MILCIGTTPATQRVMVFRDLTIDAVNRAVTTLDGEAGKSVNVAKVLHALGESVIAMGFLGGERGRELRLALEARGIPLDFLTVEAATRQCVTIIDQRSGAITELVEESRPATSTEYEELIRRLRNRAPGCRALVMSGTITPGGPVEFYRQCTGIAREVGAIAVVDAHGPLLLEALKECPGVVKPNRTELASTVGRELKDEDSLLSAMRSLSALGAERVVVTAGKSPTLAFDGHKAWRVESPPVAAINPIGSGDAFTAGLVWSLVRGDDLGEACRWAAAAGAANTLSLMAGEVEKKDVERLAGQVTVTGIT